MGQNYPLSTRCHNIVFYLTRKRFAGNSSSLADTVGTAGFVLASGQVNGRAAQLRFASVVTPRTAGKILLIGT